MEHVVDLDLRWVEVLRILGKLVIAFLAAVPIGWDREAATRSIGLRTFPLVSMASCAFVLITVEQIGAHEDAQARIVQGLIAGIGFIGGGAILKNDSRVTGTATAASIWCTGAIGAAVAYGHLETAIALSVTCFLTLRFLQPVRDGIAGEETDPR